MATTHRGDRSRTLTLYTHQLSDCCTRLRIALNLKGLIYTPITRSYKAEENSSHPQVNPSNTIPTLVVEEEGKPTVTLTQSLAALEYLDEAFPSTYQLLPPPEKVETRAQVRSLVNVITTDIHPLTTPRVRKALGTVICHAADAADTANVDAERYWEKSWMRRGLLVYENLLSDSMGNYSAGNEITMADVVLVPQVWTAGRFEIDVASEFPQVAKVIQTLMKIEAVSREWVDVGRGAFDGN